MPAASAVIDYWALPGMRSGGGQERVAAVGLHISLVCWSGWRYAPKVILYFAAVLYHAAVNALATIALSFNLNVWFIEAARRCQFRGVVDGIPAGAGR